MLLKGGTLDVFPCVEIASKVPPGTEGVTGLVRFYCSISGGNVGMAPFWVQT